MIHRTAGEEEVLFNPPLPLPLTLQTLRDYRVITIIVIIITELTHSKTILENSLKIKPQPTPLDFENLS